MPPAPPVLNPPQAPEVGTTSDEVVAVSTTRPVTTPLQFDHQWEVWEYLCLQAQQMGQRDQITVLNRIGRCPEQTDLKARQMAQLLEIPVVYQVLSRRPGVMKA